MKNNKNTDKIIQLLKEANLLCEQSDEMPMNMILTSVLGVAHAGHEAEMLLVNKLGDFVKDVLLPMCKTNNPNNRLN
jgi:hypothetical protein